MSRAVGFIRRHPRSFAGLAVVLLAAGVAFTLGLGAPVRTPAPRTVAAASVVRASSGSPSPTFATHSVVPAKTTGHAPAAGSRGRAGAVVRPGVRVHGPGVAAPAPTSHGLAAVLRQTTGLAPAQVTTRQLCPTADSGHARCAAEALVLRSNGALVHPRVARASSGGPLYGDAPAYLQQAYDLSSLSQTNGTGDTVAIVDAFHDSTAETDLAAYRSFYNLPACTSASGCFRQMNEHGGPTPPPISDAGWSQETSLDLDAVSAICPNCRILLVEANSTYSNDMQAAMQTAAAHGANQISASWTIASSSALSGQYAFPGVATVAATGDTGYLGAAQDNFPAALPGVTAAGGTTLTPASQASNLRGFGEGAWSGGGSGCATEIAKPAYQSDTGCTGRSYADLSADANPGTGLAVYDNGSWLQLGGTSLATPIIAAYYAITGVTNSSPQWAYGNSGALNDVVSGSNGTNCYPIYICTASVGYDGPTGVGSISGAAVTGAPGIGSTYTPSVAAHSATIAGGIYRNGLDSTWSIQYGTSSQYGQATFPIDIGAGSPPLAVTGYLSQLTPSTTYHYRLVAENSRGTTYGNDLTFTTPAAPAGGPTAAFTVSPTPPAPNVQVTFDASSSTAGNGTLQSYAWNFGDGSGTQTSSGPTTTHTFTTRGVTTVSLTVTNDSGQTDTTTQMVTVDDPPTPAFTPSATVNNPDAVNVDGSNSAAATGGEITHYSWDFGDGTTQDTGATAIAGHTYAAPGTYTIKLTTTDELGVSNTVSETVTVLGFSASSNGPTPGEDVTFIGPNSGGSFGTITDYSWNFGDGTTDDTATSPTDAHAFLSRGTYSVSLTITGSDGTFTSTEMITVDTPPDGVLPPSPIIATPGQSVSLDGSNSTPAPGGSIRSYTWNFGDGTGPVTAGSPSATHVYTAPGRYTATLTVTDNLGVTANAAAAQTVIVDQPAAAFSSSSSTLAPNAIGTFDATGSTDSLGPITDYSWNFGDGSSKDAGATATTTHSYTQRGSYAVALTVTNSYGQTATTTTHAVTVDNAPTAAFTPSATVATTGATLGFNAGPSAAMTGGSIADYSWSFGDGSSQDTGATATASYAYAAAGTYTVSLTTTDDLGMSATVSKQVTIETPTPPAPTPTTVTPAPDPTPAPAPTTPAPKPLSASVAAVKQQRLAPALAHGLRISLSVSQAARASFQVTIPVSQTKLAHSARKPRTRSIALLQTGAQAVGTGAHALTLKLSRAAAGELAGAGPLVLSVKVTLTGANGSTISRTVKVTLTR
ncbi:MAG TPA: PKD domain-containing protein [Solirubrobacteraceae bacterium]|nr:PKD domain-containing protein [Solirubrobacteraceae bacterium]